MVAGKENQFWEIIPLPYLLPFRAENTNVPHMSKIKTFESARKYYPRGLKQPHNSFRFSMDALLLAAFVKIKKMTSVLDLGCGCGVIGFGVLLANPSAKILGIDINEELIESASVNAKVLGLEQNYQAMQLDLCNIRKSTIAPESFDVVVSNPPFRRQNQGRVSQTDMRGNALFESSAKLDDFIGAATFALKNQGNFYCIFSSERMAELISLLDKYRLEPKLIQPVQSLCHKRCELILLKATKNARQGLKLEPSLLVYEQQATHGSQPVLTEQILNFSPWLACNSKQKQNQ